MLNLPTAYWHELATALDTLELPECVRLVIIGGEVASAQHYQRWLAHAPQRAQLINAYGPTETTVTATYYRARSDETDGLLPIGRPLAGVTCAVIDADGRDLPQGEAGELAIGGVGVGIGYLNRPQLMARQFEPDPHTEQAGGRRYRTGDRVRLREDGELEFLGRLDEQIKWHGFRIEPEEIRLALTRLPDVADAVVLLQTTPADEPVLAAYCVPLPSRALDVEILRSALAQRLPEYMVPSVIIALDRLPMTPSGKLDRRALSAPIAVSGSPPAAASHARSEVVPETATEHAMVCLWAEIFERDDLDAGSDFLAVGGHSLIGARLALKIETHFGVECTVLDLMREGSIRALSRYVDRRTAHAVESEPMRKAGAGNPVPLTRAQKRLWFLWNYETDAEGLYAEPLAYRLSGVLDLEALCASLGFLVARHDVLRMRFRAPGGEPQAELLEPFRVVLTPEPIAAESLEDALRDEARRPFALDVAAPWRVRLFRLSETEHALTLTLHHIITDGHSIALLGDELGRSYGAFAAGKTPDWPAPEINFTDYAWWQQSRETPEALAEQLDAWHQVLSGYENLDLPTDAPRPPRQGFRGEILRFTLDERLSESLAGFATAQGATLFMLLLTAYQTLLQRYAGHQDLVVGVPVANRPRAELEDVLGLFVNTLPLRCAYSPGSSFRERVEQTKTVCLDAYARQETPLELMIEALKVPRDPSRSPLFQTLMSLLSDPLPAFDAAGLSATEIPVHSGAALFELSFYFEEVDGQISGYAEFNAELFSRERIARMLGAFETLLWRGLEQPDRPLEDLDLLPEAERQLLLHDWNDTARPYPRDQLLHQLIDAQAAKTPERIAAVFRDESLSYAELRQRSDRVAARLQGLGVAPGELVGVCLARSLDLLVALLGVLKTGAAYVPLDPDFPSSRLAYMVENAEVALILTQSDLLGELPDLGDRPRLLLDQERDGLYASHEPAPSIPTDPESRAYVIYTSGSTGQPKGVQIPHRAVVNFLLSMQECPGLNPEDTVLALTTLSFDIAVLELYLPLITGAKVALVTREDARDSFQLIKRLRATPVTVMQATPATYRMLLDAHWKGDPKLKILCGGEPLPPDLAEQLLARSGELWNMYGPTETTVWSTVQRIEQAEAPISIGRPIANTQLYLLDSARQPVPVGAVGELWIGGAGTAIGYMKRPELTAERFIPNPFAPDGGLIYNTGDLARYRADGRVDCLGRSDFQVKISGYRLELGEIEAALKACPEIEDAVVTAVDIQGSGKRLVAYFIAQSPDEGVQVPSAGALRAMLMDHLPDYMIPGIFVAMQQFPLTPNAKVDRNALPLPDVAEASDARERVPPYTPEQEAICDAYKAVLSLSEVSITDNFFELGGDSLRAIQVIDRLHQAGLELRVESLFRYDSIEALARVLENRYTASGSSTSPTGIDDCLVTLREGDPDRFPPLFLVHSPPGDLLGYANLVQALDPEQPIYGFQSVGLFAPEQARESIEAMAADYCHLIQEYFPGTPYSLSGWCLGGTVAYEMACQLRAAGRPPALLALFDTEGLRPLKRFVRYYASKALDLLLKGPKGWALYLRAKLDGLPDPDQELGFQQDAQLEHVGIFANRALVRSKNMAAVYRYRSHDYNGKLLVFPAAIQDPTKVAGLGFGWATLVDEVELVVAPGAHSTMLKPPHVEQLAALLGERLRRVAAEDR